MPSAMALAHVRVSRMDWAYLKHDIVWIEGTAEDVETMSTSHSMLR
jgi:hypothetical protein